MQAQEIEDVLNVSAILTPIWSDDAPPLANLIASLIHWANSRELADSNDVVATVVDAKPKAKRGKATESRDSDTFVEAFASAPDPSDEPDF